jgi:PAS domain S-box-containing protein
MGARGDDMSRPISASTEQLLDSAADAVVIADASGVIRLVNRQAEAMFGYVRNALLGQTLATVIPIDAITHAGGTAIDLVARRRDGTGFPVEVSITSLCTDCEPLVSVAIRDVSERNKIAAAARVVTGRKRIADEQAQLAASVRDAKRDDERAVLEAQLHQAQRLESVGQLAGGVAHDFNNLLAGIMNYAGLVSSSLQAEMKSRGLCDVEAFVTLVDDVEEITKVAKRAVALTRQLLIFSQRKVLQPEVLDFNAVIGDIEDLLRHTIGENVELKMAFAANLPSIKADRGQIDQIVMNLVVNARDAMPTGGEIVIETMPFYADEHYARRHDIVAGTYLRLMVSDTGTGMSPDVAARVFEPFFTTKPKGQGTGLGLATVYGIVTQSGGDIAISSRPGLGTTICVDLPATSDGESGPRTARSNVARSAKGETVLLVEDEEVVREPMRRMLAKNGYVVLAAPDAAQALAIVRDHSSDIDLLLTDVVMPGRSGKELWDEVIDLRPDTKVLFMSGYHQDLIANQGVLDEDVSLIEKPFSAEDLLRKVRDVLDVRPIS